MMHTSVNQKGFYGNRVSYKLIAHASSKSQLYDHERAICVILLKLLMVMDFWHPRNLTDIFITGIPIN